MMDIENRSKQLDLVVERLIKLDLPVMAGQVAEASKELAELRAYKEAAESQKPIRWALDHFAFGIGTTLFDSEQEAIDYSRSIEDSSKAIPLYAKPVPADKTVTRQDIIDVLLSTRGQSEGVTADAILELLSDKGAATVPDAIQLLQRVAASTTDKPAVAVPDGFGLIPMRNGKPDITDRMKVDCIGEFSWQDEAPYYDENGELHDYVATHVVPWDLCKAIYKRMASVAMLEATPSHSQQTDQRITEKDARDLITRYVLWSGTEYSEAMVSRFIDGWLSLEGHKLISELNSASPAHDSGQGGEV